MPNALEGNSPMDEFSAAAMPPENLSVLPSITVAEQLQDLVLDSVDVSDFLLELSEYSAALATVEGGEVFDCAVTLHRRRKSVTGAGNSSRARMLNDLQERIGQGPCLTALQQQTTVVVQETTNETRWPDYVPALLAENVHSVLAVPLVLEQGAAASINFFSTIPNTFHEGIVSSAQQYALQAQRSLRLAVRIGTTQQLAEDLQEAMKSRTVIDLAVGVIMGQQRCSQTSAFEILGRASSSRNRKLRDVARDILVNVSGHEVDTHFDR